MPIIVRPSAKLEHERLTSLINSMADGVIAVDHRCRVQEYNGAALNILDVNSSMQGKTLGSILKLVDKDGIEIDVDSMIAATRMTSTNRDLRIAYGDGSFVSLYLNIAPVHPSYGTGGQRGYVLLLRDITREKSLEEERDEFISVISHELRTPIAIAEGNISNAQYIADKSNDANIKKALEEAHTQILFLADMINDLSTLSRAERGTLTLDHDDIDVNALLTDLRGSYQQQATDKGLELVAKMPDKPLRLCSSTLYVREILQNFVTNAIKYTENGSVTLSAKADKSGVTFSVQDTGIGISKTDQARVFEKFFRSEDFRTRSNNGTGLGLYVTSKLSRLLQAEISLESELNRGSLFTIYIPDLSDKK